MGECAYYIKALFRDEKEAKKAAVRFNKLLKESTGAYDFYQKNPPNFWDEFKCKFPESTIYVKKYVLKCHTDQEASHLLKNPHDKLSGNLDFGQSDLEAGQFNNILVYGDSNVWHMASWDNLATYLVIELGAIKAVWNTEENGCGSIDSLNLYEWEEIVKDILKKKQILPLLMGINKELDELISGILKK